MPSYSLNRASLQVLNTRCSSILPHSPSEPSTHLEPPPHRFSALDPRGLPHSPSVLTWRSLLTGPQHQMLLYSTTQFPSTHLEEPPYRSSTPDPLFYHTVPQYSPGGASLQVLNTRCSSILPHNPSVPPLLTRRGLPTGPQHQILLYLAEVIESVDGEEVLFIGVPGDGPQLGDEFLPLLWVLHVLSDSCV